MVTLIFDPDLQIQERVLKMYITIKFDRPMFSRLEVIVWTNKQTDTIENIHCAPLRYAGG